MASFLHISLSAASSFTRDRQIDFDHLFSIYTQVGDTDDKDYQILCRSAMVLAMLSHFLFQTSSDILIPIVCGLWGDEKCCYVSLGGDINGS